MQSKVMGRIIFGLIRYWEFVWSSSNSPMGVRDIFFINSTWMNQSGIHIKTKLISNLNRRNGLFWRFNWSTISKHAYLFLFYIFKPSGYQMKNKSRIHTSVSLAHESSAMAQLHVTSYILMLISTLKLVDCEYHLKYVYFLFIHIYRFNIFCSLTIKCTMRVIGHKWPVTHSWKRRRLAYYPFYSFHVLL